MVVIVALLASFFLRGVSVVRLFWIGGRYIDGMIMCKCNYCYFDSEGFLLILVCDVFLPGSG
jgi:hypothetical protein